MKMPRTQLVSQPHSDTRKNKTGDKKSKAILFTNNFPFAALVYVMCKSIRTRLMKNQ